MKLGTYVVAEDGGGTIMAVNRTNPSGWETFSVCVCWQICAPTVCFFDDEFWKWLVLLQLWRVRDGYYQLRVFNKQFVGADNGGGGIVKAVATTPNNSETFQIIRNPANPNSVHIKSFNGMYMQVCYQRFQGSPSSMTFARGFNWFNHVPKASYR